MTNAAHVARVAGQARDVNILFNNAGVLNVGSVLDAPPTAFNQNFNVNFYGVLNMTRAFAPTLTTHHGAVVNILTLVALASMPGLGVYNASKAAAWSLTQSFRADFARRHVRLFVTGAVADVWGADRVGVRISPLNAFNSMFESDPGRTFGALVTELARFGLAYLHVVEEDGSPEAGPRFDIGGLRNLWNRPYIVNGNYDRSRAMKVIADGGADFVSFGKLFLANPDLPLRFARSAPLNVPDRGSFYGGDDRGYIDYPFLEEPAPALKSLVLAAGGRAEHLAFTGGYSPVPSGC